MRRLENADEEKFWEAWIKDDLIFCYRYGKIGSPGHIKLKKFKTTAEAEAELEQKLAEKLEEGFEEPGQEDAEEEEEEVAEADSSAEDEDADEADSDEEDEASEDEAEDDESEDEDEDEERAAPRKKPRATAPIAMAAPVAAPTLPPRVRSRAAAPDPETFAAAARTLEALRTAVAKGTRSWKIARLVRHARHALEKLGGADLEKHADVLAALDGTTALVIAPKRRLSLDHALELLWVTDAATYARSVSRWRAKMLNAPAAASIGLLAAACDNIPDREVAVQVAAALVNRRFSEDAFRRWLARVKPFLKASLATKPASAEALRRALKPGDDAVLKARVAEVMQ